MTELEVIKRAITERHIRVEQLRDLDIVKDSLEISPSSAGYWRLATGKFGAVLVLSKLLFKD